MSESTYFDHDVPSITCPKCVREGESSPGICDVMHEKLGDRVVYSIYVCDLKPNEHSWVEGR